MSSYSSSNMSPTIFLTIPWGKGGREGGREGGYEIDTSVLPESIERGNGWEGETGGEGRREGGTYHEGTAFLVILRSYGRLGHINTVRRVELCVLLGALCQNTGGLVGEFLGGREGGREGERGLRCCIGRPVDRIQVSSSILPPSFLSSLPPYLHAGRHLVLVRVEATSQLVRDLGLVVHPLLTAVLEVAYNALVALRG